MLSEALGEQLARSVKYVRPIPFSAATGLTAQVYQQLIDDFMPAPLVALHSPVPDILAGVWSLLRESLMAGNVNRAVKEAVSATVSKTNECPFCIDAHTVMLRAASEHDVAGAILRGDYDRIQNPQLSALVQWVLANRTAATNADMPVPFSRTDMPEIAGTVLTFHYLNRMANIFMGDSLLPIPSIMKGVTYRIYAATAGKRVIRKLPAGRSLALISRATLPEDLAFAEGNPAVAGAVAGFAQAVESAGERVLPEPVRRVVIDRVQAWNGEVMGISRRWIEASVSEVEVNYQPAVRLTLLTALASYQVDANIINAFREFAPDDADLIAACAWASWTAARRAVSWLRLP